MNYRREIDGLRAIAVTSVILFHAGIKPFSGGYIGVDVFFVISGFLITTIIIDDLNAKKFSLLDFYERRARRILPALYLMLALCIPASWLILQPHELSSFSESIAAVSTFTSNFHFAKSYGYFEISSELKPLLHTWSLSIEEQYYIIFPCLMLFFIKGPRRFLFALSLITLLSFALAQWNINSTIEGNFFLLKTRIWEISSGSLTAILLKKKVKFNSIYLNEFLSILGLGLIFSAIFIYDNATPFPSIYTLAPVIGTTLILTFAGYKTKVAALLGMPPLVFLGLISYSTYLWHQPLFAFARNYYENIAAPTMAGLLLSCLALGYLSWRFIELPFRRKDIFTRNSIFYFSISGVFIFYFYGTIISSLIGGNFESILADSLRNHRAIYASNMDERLFIKYRIDYESFRPDCIVLGSSRVMQIRNDTLGCKLLNFGVSGSSVQDDIAILGMAMSKFNPRVILIGVDPWIFNSNSSQNRWITLKSQYESTLHHLNYQDNTQLSPNRNINSFKDFFINLITSLYLKVNTNTLWANDDTPSLREKIRHDGSRVYSTSFVQKVGREREIEFEGQLLYGMNNFYLSDKLVDEFRSLIRFYSKSSKVILVLSPYHPDLYNRIEKNKLVHLDVENLINMIAHENHVEIVGSFSPIKTGCSKDDFYDGMHPNSSCMKKILTEIRDSH